MKLLVLTTALSLSMATATMADWRSERTVTGPKGGTSTATTEVSRADGSRTRATTVNRSTGTGYTREATTSYDRDSKSWTRDVTGETAGGTSWTNSGGGSCSGGACSSASTFEGSGGATVSSERETRFGEGQVTRKWRWWGNHQRSGSGERTWQRLE